PRPSRLTPSATRLRARRQPTPRPDRSPEPRRASGVRRRIGHAVRAATRDRQVADIRNEAEPRADRPDQARRIVGFELPRPAADAALEKPVLRPREGGERLGAPRG